MTSAAGITRPPPTRPGQNSICYLPRNTARGAKPHHPLPDTTSSITIPQRESHIWHHKSPNPCHHRQWTQPQYLLVPCLHRCRLHLQKLALANKNLMATIKENTRLELILWQIQLQPSGKTAGSGGSRGAKNTGNHYFQSYGFDAGYTSFIFPASSNGPIRSWSASNTCGGLQKNKPPWVGTGRVMWKIFLVKSDYLDKVPVSTWGCIDYRCSINFYVNHVLITDKVPILKGICVSQPDAFITCSYQTYFLPILQLFRAAQPTHILPLIKYPNVGRSTSPLSTS